MYEKILWDSLIRYASFSLIQPSKNKIYLNTKPKNKVLELNMDDSMQLGGSIELSGFRNLDGASMVVLKKIVGN